MYLLLSISFVLFSCEKEKDEPVICLKSPSLDIDFSQIRMCTEMVLDDNLSDQSSINTRAVSLDGRTWAPGTVVRIKFLNGDDYLKNKVKQYANEWIKYVHLEFKFVTGSEYADIKIGFQWNGDNGSWSQIGTASKGVSQNSPSMNFGWFNASTSEQEFGRVILHEFGHALGLIHEHQHPYTNIQWNKPAVYEYYKRNNGWSASYVDKYIFYKYSSQETTSRGIPDFKSIMHYAVPKELTVNGFSVEWSSVLSSQDIYHVGELYPIGYAKSGKPIHKITGFNDTSTYNSYGRTSGGRASSR